MLKNYLKIAFRNFWGHKGYSFINIFGLALGIAVTILITLFIYDELSFDRYNEHAKDIYRVVERQNYSSTVLRVQVTPGPLGPALKKDYPEVMEAVRYMPIGGAMVKFGDQSFTERFAAAVDSTVFNLFTFPLIAGDPNTALTDPNSMVVTESTARKYFGDENPMGKVVKLEGQYDFRVTGVMKDIPKNSHIQPGFLIPYPVVEQTNPGLQQWGNNSINTYIRLRENANPEAFEAKIAGLAKEHNEGSVVTLYLQPLTRIHLFSDFGYGPPGMGNVKYVYIAGISALFILLISIINFVSLTTARYSNRTREVGIRKVLGAHRRGLIRQFLSESALITVMALILAFILIEFFFPVFNRITQKQLGWGLFQQPVIPLSLIALTVFIALIAGAYPAFFLSGFRPATVLKAGLVTGRQGARFRKTLVLLQWVLSIILIIGTSVVYGQLNYIRHKDLGYDKDHIITFQMPYQQHGNYYAFKHELQTLPGVIRATGTEYLPNRVGSSTSSVDWDGKNENETYIFSFSRVDYDYVETFGIQMAAGRSFSPEFPSDSVNAFLVNETAVKAMGMTEPVGKRFRWWDTEGTIIGVMKDFNYSSLRSEIQPLMFRVDPKNIDEVCLKVSPENIQETVAQIEDAFHRFYPSGSFDYQFFDQTFDQQYRSEQRMGDMFKYVAILSIFIACLGLFGLSAFVAEQKTKEIGVRKVLGATVPDIVRLLSGEFMILALVANLIAWPAAWYFMHRWLSNFAYHMNLSFWMFAGAGLLALIVVLLTVGFNGVKAAVINPARSLRYE